MEILYLLIPLSVALAFLIGAAFWWSVAHGQFDDLEGPAHRILTDDDSVVDLNQESGPLGHLPSPLRLRGRAGAQRGANAMKERTT
jgi:cbb3-type cytochrome oxidase maturation protein